MSAKEEESSKNTPVNGPLLVARILKYLPSAVTARLSSAIKSEDPAIFEKIEESYFSLNELTTLPANKVQTLVSRASHQDLVSALQAASEEAKAHLLSCVSERKQKLIAEDLSLPPLEKGKDLREAHQRIFSLIEEIQKGTPTEPRKKGLRYA